MSADGVVRVLLLADDVEGVECVRQHLEGSQAELTVVGALTDALAWLGTHPAHVVLMGPNLLTEQVLQAVSTLRARFDPIPLVMLAEHCDHALAVQAVQAGADDVIEREDLTPRTLWRVVQLTLERRRQQTDVFSKIWENADAMVLLDEQGRILFANQAAAAVFHRDRASLPGLTLGLPATADQTEIQVLREDGTVTDALMRTTSTVWNGQAAWLASIRDLSELRRAEFLEQTTKQAEIARRDSEARLALLVDNLPVVMWTADAALSVTSARGLGDSAQAQAWLGPLLAANLPAYERARQVGMARIEHSFDEKDFEGVVRWRSPQGTEDGEFIGLALDISERKGLEEQVRQAQKMEAVGRLAGGVAHDFNNLLTVILNFGDFARKSLPAGSPAADDLQEILRAADRAAHLTSQLLAFSRRQPINPQVVNINDLIKKSLRMLARVLGEDVHIELELAHPLSNTKIDPGAFEQVLLNLCINARDAMPSGGTLVLSTSVEASLPGGLVDVAGAAAGGDDVASGFVKMVVADDGEGIAPEIQERVFEPFFTTKGVGKGTGLGLATCYGIVSQAGGRIAVVSGERMGTAMHVTLPAVEGAAAAELPPRPSAATGGERVLLVEDQVQVRRLAQRILEDLGYQVLVAADGPSALRILADVTDPVDLLLTDVVMPRMSGRELADRVLAKSPDIRVLYMSGYAHDVVADRGVRAAAFAFLEKPFTQEQLGRKVRDVLDQ